MLKKIKAKYLLFPLFAIFPLLCCCANPGQSQIGVSTDHNLSLDIGNTGSTVVSTWAKAWIDVANNDRILPDALSGGDYTMQITRTDLRDLAYNVMRYIDTHDFNFGTLDPADPDSFKKIDDPKVLALCNEAILQGKTGQVTREEAAVIFMRLAAYFNLRTFKNELTFSDAGNISDWAKAAVDTACGIGFMTTTGDSTFTPQGVYTKEQAITALCQFIGCVSVPGSGEQIAGSRFIRSNIFHLWVEDSGGNVIFAVPRNDPVTKGYYVIQVIRGNGRMLCAAYATGTDTSVFEVRTGEKLCSLPDLFFSMAKDGNNIIIVNQATKGSGNTFTSDTLFGVYDLSGNAVVPIGVKWAYLYKNGYVDSASPGTVPNANVYASMSHFTKQFTYTSGQFADVDENSWYGLSKQGVVASACELGIMSGTGGGRFNPIGQITVAEAIKAAVIICDIYNGGSGVFTQGNPWYQVYVDYAVKNGIINNGVFTDYTAVATRAQLAYIFSNAVPIGALQPINMTTNLPDIAVTDKYAANIFMLYNAGVLQGCDASGSFAPDRSITRAEVAAIISRITFPGKRMLLGS